MAITKTANSLNTYTVDTWTDLVTGVAAGNTIKSVLITNPTASDISVQMRVANSGGNALATVLPSTTISAGESQLLNFDVLNLVSSGKLQINADVAGLNFYASGVSY